MDAVTSRNVIFYSLLQEIHASGIEISVTVTANASAVRDWLTAALYSSRYYVHLKRLVVGLSVHWTLSGANLNTPAHTLQLLIGRRILIFQLAHATTVPNKLRTFLLNPSHTFVGLSNFWDPQKLLCSRHRLRVARAPVDLVLYVNTLLRGRLPKEIVIERCLGFQVERRFEVAESDWRNENLSDDQIVFATVRALCAFLIGLRYRAWEI